LGGRNNTPPQATDPTDTELSNEDIREAMRELLERIGPDRMAWLILGVPNANQRSTRRAIVSETRPR
jgi:hypothetical protein